MQQWASLVVYCDGGDTRHESVPLSAYQRTEGEWLPIHSALFNGEWVVLPDNAIDELVGNEQLPEFREVEERQDQVAALPGEYRTQYRWRCTVPGCAQNVMANDHAAIHRLFDLLGSVGQVALAQIQAFQRDEAARHKSR